MPMLSALYPFAYLHFSLNGPTASLYTEHPTVGGAVPVRYITAPTVAALRERLNVEGYLARDYELGVYSQAVPNEQGGLSPRA